MFKDFQSLNTALSRAVDTSERNRVETILSFIDEIRSMANSIASEYAKNYSQVQWMKYDSDGNPTDVTPSSQQNVPNARLKSAVERVNSAVARLESLASGSTVTQVINPLNEFISGYAGLSILFNGGVPTLVASSSSLRHVPQSTTLFSTTFSSAAVLSFANSNLTFQAGRKVEVEIGSLNDGATPFTCFMIEDATVTKILGMIIFSRADSRCYVITPPNGDLNIDGSNYANAVMYSGTINYSSVAGRANVFGMIHEVLDATDISYTGSIPGTSFGSISMMGFIPAGYATSVNITVPEISPSTFCPNYQNLVNALKAL